jgi:hypothetical protein
MHLEWLQKQYDAERMSTNRAEVLDTLMQQMQTLTNAMHGIVTPPKGVSHGGADTNKSTPDYKLSDAGVMASLKDDTKSANEMIKALGLSYSEANKGTRLMLDTPPDTALKILRGLNKHMALAVPDGPLGAALMDLTVPIDATRVPASAVPDVRSGKTPPRIEARQLLASVVGSTTAGSGSAYLADLRASRLKVSNMLITDPRWNVWQRVYTQCLRSICTPTLLGVVGAPTDALDMAVRVLAAVGNTYRENLLRAYREVSQPMEPPEFGNMAQPQELLMWFKLAITIRMDQIKIIGMEPAMLAYLAFLQGLPDGSGEMAHVLSEKRAIFEGFLASEESKTPDVILARITAEIEDLGTRRWPGSLKSLKPPRSAHGDGVDGYAADAVPESSHTESDAAGGSRQPEVPRPVCPYWQAGIGCRNNPCKKAHPNGKSKCSPEEAVCVKWLKRPDGCDRDQCQYRHPNGKSKQDESTTEGTFNKRDLTPVGKRHTPVEKEKGGVVPVDPKAAAAHGRNRHPRLRYDPNSD